MVFQWARLPDADSDLTASSDTTETQIGTGITVPTWAKSIKAVRILHRLITLTTAEEVCGYLRLLDDQNKIEPFYMPLPIAQAIGTVGTHHGYQPIVLPVELPVTPNDVLRAYSALDAATTGAHTMVVYVLFSSEEPRFIQHAAQSGVQTQSTSSVTAATTAETIYTVAGKTSAILGVWGYMVAGGGITAAESVTGYVKITSNVERWLTQRIPLNNQPSGLGATISPDTKPTLCIHKSLHGPFPPQGVTLLPWPHPFPVKTRQPFDFTGYMDGANTNAPTARFGLIWRE